MECKIAFPYKGQLYLPGMDFKLEDLDLEDNNDVFKRNHFVQDKPITVEVVIGEDQKPPLPKKVAKKEKTK